MRGGSRIFRRGAGRRWSLFRELLCRALRCFGGENKPETRNQKPETRIQNRPFLLVSGFWFLVSGLNAMAQEIEVKFPLRDRHELVRRLHDIGGQRLYPETFEDNIVLDRRGELRTKGALLRVRKFGKYSIATFKGPMSIEGGVKTREEVQTGVESFELAIQLFDSLGYKPVFRYQKFREVWRVREAEVVIDRTPIGEYFEIEGQIDMIR